MWSSSSTSGIHLREWKQEELSELPRSLDCYLPIVNVYNQHKCPLTGEQVSKVWYSWSGISLSAYEGIVTWANLRTACSVNWASPKEKNCMTPPTWNI
jgi:hypothetical protein